MKNKSIIGLFITILLLISILPLASASTLGVVSTWVVNGQSVSGKTLTVNVGEKVNFATYVTPSDNWVDYNLDVILQNGAKQKIKDLWNIAFLYGSYSKSLSYTPTTAGTYYILSNAYDNVNSQDADTLTLIVKNPQICVPGITETLSTCWDGSVKESRTCNVDGMSWTVNPANVCPVQPVLGCTDPEATNYNPQANQGDDSCIYPHANLQFLKIQPASEMVTAGGLVLVNIKVQNNGNVPFKDLSVSMFSYDLGFKRVSGQFDLNPGKSKNLQLYAEVPYQTLSGDYILEFTLGDDHFRDVAYRQVIVL
jgi:hypothetical protein